MEKRFTIAIPEHIWKALKLLQIDGKIKSLNQAAIEGLESVVKNKGGKK